MKKKGFTLVELLAVIAILAILVIIALPNVLGMFNQAKKNTFVTELQSIYSTAETQFVSDSMGDMTSYTNGIRYGRYAGTAMNVDGEGFKYLDLSGTTSINFYIHFNLAGKVTEFYATDGQFQYIYANGNGLAKQDITSTDVKADSTVGCGDGNIAGNGSSATCDIFFSSTPKPLSLAKASPDILIITLLYLRSAMVLSFFCKKRERKSAPVLIIYFLSSLRFHLQDSEYR